MSDLTPDTLAEIREALADLDATRLPPAGWRALPEHLGQLGDALDRGDEQAARAALVPVSRAVFEGKVQSRLGHRRPKASVVIPTKKTPALPVVGAVCGALLLALGWQLGGGLVLAGTAALALLVLGVAVAGTQANSERAAARQSRTTVPDTRVPAPEEVRALIAALRARHPSA